MNGAGHTVFDGHHLTRHAADGADGVVSAAADAGRDAF
jgi:hypothetical protein